MFYDFAIVVTAGTPATAPIEQKLKLTHGVIHRVEVEFYPGVERTVSLSLYHGGHQLYPTNPEGKFSTNGYTIAFDDFYELTAAPYLLKARAYSPNAIYDHTIVVRIGLIESEVALSMLKVAKGLTKFLKLVGITI